MEPVVSGLLSHRLLTARRAIARRWSACGRVDDPVLLALSQQLDIILLEVMAHCATTAELDPPRR